MTLLLCHPELPTCDDCEKYVYDEHWKQIENPIGEGPMLRDGARPPCMRCPKCATSPEKSPAAGRQAELSPRNRQCLEHYWATKDGCLTEEEKRDPVVRRTRAIINQVYDHYRTAQSAGVLSAMAGAIVSKRR